jgi:phasin family protein
MQNEIIEKMTEAGQTSYAAMQELSAINTKTLKTISELQIGFATYSIESGVEFVKTLSSLTSYKDLMSLETEYATDYGTKVMELGNKTTEVLNESRDDVVSFFEKSIEKAAAEPKKAPKRTSKKAAAA